MSTFASAFASNFNIVSMVMLTLTQRMGTEPILCICILLPLCQLFSKTQTQTLTVSVNGPLLCSTLNYHYHGNYIIMTFRWRAVPGAAASDLIVLIHVLVVYGPYGNFDIRYIL